MDIAERDPIRHVLDLGYPVAEIKRLLDSGIPSPELLNVTSRYVPPEGEERSPVVPLIPLRASDVTVKPVSWLWDDVLVAGALNSIQGIAGVGKTFLLCAVAAAVSCGGYVQGASGKMERLKQGRVLLLTGDDDVSTTIVPRLIEFGAELSGIHFLPEGALPPIGSDGFAQLAECARPDLLIVDTLQHFLPPKVDLNSANATTNALQPLKLLAERYSCAVVVIQHISKTSASGNGGHSVNFGIGSGAVNGLFRSVWTLGRLRDDDGRPSAIRALAPSKTNLVAGDLPAILFELTQERGFRWVGIDHELTAEMLYDPLKKRVRISLARQEAENFLLSILADGDKLSVLIKQEAREAGISIETLNDAKKHIGVESYQKARSWYWTLHPQVAISAGTNNMANNGNLTPSDNQGTQIASDSHTLPYCQAGAGWQPDNPANLKISSGCPDSDVGWSVML